MFKWIPSRLKTTPSDAEVLCACCFDMLVEPRRDDLIQLILCGHYYRDVVEITATVPSYGNLGLASAKSGKERLKALSSTDSASGDVVA